MLLVIAGAGVSYALRGSPHRTSSSSTVPVGTSMPSAASSTPSPPAADVSFASLYKDDSNGVVRIETVGCTDQGVGTGFLLSPTVIATVAHVVEQSAVISLVDGAQRTTGTVIGMDPQRDLALVRSSQPLTGHVFTLAQTQPDVGSRVAAIGFPIGDPITLTQGGISGLDRSIMIGDSPRTGLIETDAPINPGNSGGPLLDSHGTVVGLVDALNTAANGMAYAVPAADTSADFGQWQSSPQAQPGASCANPVGPSAQAAPNISPPSGSGGAAASGISDALTTYFQGINTADYAAAYAVLSPRQQSTLAYADFVNGVQTSFDTGVSIDALNQQDASTYIASISFQSIQTSSQGPNGDSCDNWTLDYTMVQSAGGPWQIDTTAGQNGMTHTAC